MIVGIVLAAGTSSRLGRPKQLLDLGGQPLLVHVVDAALASPLDQVVVVLGHEAAQIGKVLPIHTARVRAVLNPAFASGQSSSLVAGLGALDRNVEAAVVLLGDQPGVRPEAVVAVVEAWRQGGRAVVQATYGGRPGHPVLFARSMWPELTRLTGDRGARDLVAAHGGRATVEMGSRPPEDVDTEEEYRRLVASWPGERPG